MWMLFLEGGYSMWFLLAFGLATIAAAGRFGWRPSRAGLRVCIGLGATTLFSIFTGVAVDLSAVGHKVPEYVVEHPGTNFAETVLLGVAESMSPAIIGFTFLGMASLLVTYGLSRLDES